MLTTDQSSRPTDSSVSLTLGDKRCKSFMFELKVMTMATTNHERNGKSAMSNWNLLTEQEDFPFGLVHAFWQVNKTPLQNVWCLPSYTTCHWWNRNQSFYRTVLFTTVKGLPNILQILIGSWKAQKAKDFKKWGKMHPLSTRCEWLWRGAQPATKSEVNSHVWSGGQNAETSPPRTLVKNQEPWKQKLVCFTGSLRTVCRRVLCEAVTFTKKKITRYRTNRGVCWLMQ